MRARSARALVVVAGLAAGLTACLPAVPPFPEHLYTQEGADPDPDGEVADTRTGSDAAATDADGADAVDSEVTGPPAPSCAFVSHDGTCVVVDKLALGTDHGCAALSDDTIRCWGDDARHQLGPEGGVALGDGTVLSLTAGDGFTCAVVEWPSTGRFEPITHEVLCWGGGDLGQLGRGSEDDRDEPLAVPIDTEGTPNLVVAGGATACVNFVSTPSLCWGRLPGPDGGVTGPVVPGDGGGTWLHDFAVGDAHACGSAGGVKCWGANDRGQLGAGPGGASASLVDVADPMDSPWSLAAGAHHTCAVLDKAELRCWGAGDRGQLGTAALEDADTPVEPKLGLDAVPNGALSQVVAGRAHTCIDPLPNRFICFGDNTAGQLGYPDAGERLWKPADFLVTEYGLLAAGGDSTCGVRITDKRLECWGSLGGSGALAVEVELGSP